MNFTIFFNNQTLQKIKIWISWHWDMKIDLYFKCFIEVLQDLHFWFLMHIHVADHMVHEAVMILVKSESRLRSNTQDGDGTSHEQKKRTVFLYSHTWSQESLWWQSPDPFYASLKGNFPSNQAWSSWIKLARQLAKRSSIYLVGRLKTWCYWIFGQLHFCLISNFVYLWLILAVCLLCRFS